MKQLIKCLIRYVKRLRYGMVSCESYLDALPFWTVTLKELSLFAYWKDFFLNPKRFALKKKVFALWRRQQRELGRPVYWAGWFYQSLNCIQLCGWRDTQRRIDAYSLLRWIKSTDTVLDIGGNAGFIPITLANRARMWTCVEPNGYLKAINDEICDYLNIDNIDFIPTGFEDYEPSEVFDVICAFASHSTYDGNSKLSPPEFFDKVSRLLIPNGRLLFESHNGELENPSEYQKIVGIISERFEVQEHFSFRSPERTLLYQKAGVQRDFIVARKKSEPALCATAPC